MTDIVLAVVMIILSITSLVVACIIVGGSKDRPRP